MAGKAGQGEAGLGEAGQAWEMPERRKTMVYKWKDGSHHKVSAQVAGEVCAALEERGELNAQNLVDVSRPEDAPLHDEFTWNNDVAAELWRTEQARKIIQHISLKTETPTPVRAFFNIEVKSPNYESLNAIVKHEDKYAALLKTALRELEAFRRKYMMLSELELVMQAIEDVEKAASDGNH